MKTLVTISKKCVSVCMLAALLLAQASCAANDAKPSGTLDKYADTQTAQ